ncbi:uncharacterized protein LOC144203201 [Stigmatopora nigra]
MVIHDSSSSITHFDSSLDLDPLSSSTPPSCTPLSLELHIDEDGCSTPTFTTNLTTLTASKKGGGGIVTSEISNFESFGVSNGQKQPIQKFISTSSESTNEVSNNEVSDSQYMNSDISNLDTAFLVAESKQSPPSLPKQSRLTQDHSPLYEHDNQAPGPGLDMLNINESSVTPTTPETLPMSARPVTVPKSSGQVSSNVRRSPALLPKLAIPVPKLESPMTVHGVSSIETASKSCTPELVAKIAQPVRPNISSLSPVRKSENPAARSPTVVVKKTYMVAATSTSPTNSPVSLAASPTTPSSPPTKYQQSEIMDLTWPCRDPVLDNALDKLLTPELTPLDESRTPTFFMLGEENRPWDVDDALYPDVSREDTLTPMTEASWLDECFTPSTCPGTPDAALDLPTQQPSAIERISTSGQLKSVIRRTKETTNVHPMYKDGVVRRKMGPVIVNKSNSQDRLIEELQGKLGIGRVERRRKQQPDDWLTEGVIVMSNPQRIREDRPVDKVDIREV